ncbi:MAG: hypothetical protein ACI9VR_003308 [Cognaticolwellia sp.]|jgi:hypothetical protein
MTRKRSRVHPRVKTKYRVPNWTEYDRTLVRRGDITVWLHHEARVSSEDSVIGRGVRSRWRHECCQALEQCRRGEHDAGGAISPGPLEPDEQLAAVRPLGA